MDDWAALRLQMEWGADEALVFLPINRLQARSASTTAAPTQLAETLFAPATRMPDVAGRPTGAMAAIDAVGASAAAEALAAACTTIAELRSVVAGFTLCALRDTATSLVFAEGNATSGLMLIGDAPAADEDRAGRPFTGAAGDYLDRMLSSVGLDRTQMLLAPLIPWRPPGDRMPSPTELAACLPFLWRLIALVAPRHVLLLGPNAARCLLPASNRRRSRGIWANMQVPGIAAPIAALTSSSPAALLTQPRLRREVWADLRKVRRELENKVTSP